MTAEKKTKHALKNYLRDKAWRVRRHILEKRRNKDE